MKDLSLLSLALLREDGTVLTSSYPVGTTNLSKHYDCIIWTDQTTATWHLDDYHRTTGRDRTFCHETRVEPPKYAEDFVVLSTRFIGNRGEGGKSGVGVCRLRSPSLYCTLCTVFIYAVLACPLMVICTTIILLPTNQHQRQ